MTRLMSPALWTPEDYILLAFMLYLFLVAVGVTVIWLVRNLSLFGQLVAWIINALIGLALLSVVCAMWILFMVVSLIGYGAYTLGRRASPEPTTLFREPPYED